MPQCRQRESLAQYFAREGKQRQVSCSLDGDSHLALVFGAIAGLAAGTDFAIFMNIATQQVVVFVIDFLCFVAAECANAGAGIVAATAAAATSATAASAA